MTSQDIIDSAMAILAHASIAPILGAIVGVGVFGAIIRGVRRFF